MKKLSYAVLKEQGYDGYLLESAPERVLQFGEGNLIRTFKKEEFNADEIRTSMIGRELQGDYYRSDFTPSSQKEAAITALYPALKTPLRDSAQLVWK